MDDTLSAKDNIVNKETDYLFRYPVGEKEKDGERDPLLEMIHTQLASLLGLLSLYHKGEEVKVDGFRLMNERKTIHPISPPEASTDEPQSQPGSQAANGQDEKLSFQSVRTAELYEPRIPHINKVLESLLSVVTLEANGKPVKIDGFRLKKPGPLAGPFCGGSGGGFRSPGHRVPLSLQLLLPPGESPFARSGAAEPNRRRRIRRSPNEAEIFLPPGWAYTLPHPGESL